MTNDIAKVEPYRNPLETASPEQIHQHRLFLVERARSILSNFWDNDDTPAAKALTLAEWADALMRFSEDEINAAWAKYRAIQVDKHGRLKYRPCPENIIQLIYRLRPKPELVKTTPEPEVKKDLVTPESAAAICEAAGFHPKLFGRKS